MRSGTNSDIVKCLESEVRKDQKNNKDATCVAKHRWCCFGAANKTFLDYSEKVFLPHLYQGCWIKLYDRTWFGISALKEALKGFIRAERGKGVRQRVGPSATIPSNCSNSCAQAITEIIV